MFKIELIVHKRVVILPTETPTRNIEIVFRVITKLQTKNLKGVTK